MAVPARLLINRSWYLSGIVARNLETVSGQQAKDGLFLLNALLEFKAADTKFIPYYQLYTLTLTTGQESYFIPNLVDIETFTFNIDNIRFPTTSISRVNYFGSGRVDNIDSLPFEWHYEREKGGSRLSVYFRPDQNYTAHIMGKFALTDVTQNTDLSTVYDGFYIEYLRYSLAEYMCMEYNIEFPADKKAYLNKMERKLMWISPPDLSLKKTNFINSATSMNWAQANIGKGWTA